MIKLNPIKHLGGKLGHLHIPQSRYLRIVELANSLRARGSTSTLSNHSVEEIQALSSPTSSVNARSFHKFEFDLGVHSDSARKGLPSTVFDDLNPHERKISLAIATFTSQLNSRQLLYLNLAFRKKIAHHFLNWNTLHLSEISPSKVDLEVIPTLTSASRLPVLKTLPKATVIKEIIIGYQEAVLQAYHSNRVGLHAQGLLLALSLCLGYLPFLLILFIELSIAPTVYYRLRKSYYAVFSL